MVEVKLSDLEYGRYQEIKSWCEDQYGRSAWWKKQLDNSNSKFQWFVGTTIPDQEWQKEGKGTAIFAFRDEKESTMFSLKWGEK